MSFATIEPSQTLTVAITAGTWFQVRQGSVTINTGGSFVNIMSNEGVDNVIITRTGNVIFKNEGNSTARISYIEIE